MINSIILRKKKDEKDENLPGDNIVKRGLFAIVVAIRDVLLYFIL